MIVNFFDFKGEARIPNLFPVGTLEDGVNKATQDEVMDFINEYEPKYLEMFFDDDKEEIQDIVEYSLLPPEERTDDVKNKLLLRLKKAIARYVAFYYFRDNTVVNSGVGAVIMQPQHAERTDIVDKCVVVWNKMVAISKKAYVEYFDEHKFLHRRHVEIFRHINFVGV